jgi:hypothetical protein
MTIDIPPLPEGWSGTPDELLQFIEENATFPSEGSSGGGGSVIGQVGGSTPTEDVGVWFNNDSIEIFRDGRYRPITDVPVGALLAFGGSITTVPANYLLCDGSSLIRTDYADLFTAIGDTWGSDSPTTFSLPNPASRMPVGAGTGQYEDNSDGQTGEMNSHEVGDYYGREWVRKENKKVGAPSDVQSVSGGTIVASGGKYTSVEQPAFTVYWIIRYR